MWLDSSLFYKCPCILLYFNVHALTYQIERKRFHFDIYTYLPLDLLLCFSGLSCEAVGQGYVSYGLGADISLSLCLSERPGVLKLCTLRLKATDGSKFRGASSRYSALTTRPELPSPDTPFTQDTRMRTFIYFMPCVGTKSKNQSRSQSPRVRHRVLALTKRHVGSGKKIVEE